MTTEQKKSFLEAISQQIKRYNGCIEYHVKYVGIPGGCPICREFYDHDNYGGRSSINGVCGKCPMFFFIQNDPDVGLGPGYPCSYRMTYPDQIMDIIKSYRTYINDPSIYGMEAEWAAREFWKTVEKLVKRTAAKNIILTDNSKFVISMFKIDKKIRASIDKEIEETYKSRK